MPVADRFRAAVGWLRRHRRVAVALQVVTAAVLLIVLAVAVRDSWRGAGERLRDANLVDFGLGCGVLGAYYLLFVVGWMRILAAWDIHLSYGVALRAEMLSMLAKYIPGGIWTPAARVLAVRRAGIDATALVTASILIDAGLSAISGVIVFVVSLAWVEGVEAPLAPLIVFAVVVAVLLHPSIFGRLAGRLFRRLGYAPPPDLPASTILFLLVYYTLTWLVGGAALYFLVNSVGGDVTASSIAFLGGTAAVGAIVAVLSIVAPSGLGPREASMYGLLLAVTPQGAALGATVLNRVAITVVEAALLLVGILLLRRHTAERNPLAT
jgi:glycosyltransferase 2 family protein